MQPKTVLLKWSHIHKVPLAPCMMKCSYMMLHVCRNQMFGERFIGWFASHYQRSYLSWANDRKTCTEAQILHPQVNSRKLWEISSPSSIRTHILKRIQFSIELYITSHSTCFPRHFCWMIFSLHTEVQVTIPPCPLRHRNRRMPWYLGWAKHGCEKNAMGFMSEDARRDFFKKTKTNTWKQYGCDQWNVEMKWLTFFETGRKNKWLWMQDPYVWCATLKMLASAYLHAITWGHKPKGPFDDFFLQHVITTLDTPRSRNLTRCASTCYYRNYSYNV